MAARVDFRQRLTNALIESIEENDGLPWEKSWADMAIRPFNPITGTRYKGGNVINLLLEQIKRGSDDPRWMTLKQANDAGYSIRKGAKAVYVEYWDWSQPQESRKAEAEVDEPHVETEESAEDKAEESAEGKAEVEQRRKPRVFYAAVFNGCDIVGLPEIKREISWQPNELAEKLIAATGAKIEHTAVSLASSRVMKNAAYYSYGQDKIVVPPRESFKSDGDYYATVLHELAHWTGHHSRLARYAPDDKLQRSLTEYAKEEMRAEIASMFLTSMLGVQGNIQNHAKYTEIWLEVLKGDRHEIFRAARDAEKIVDYIFDYAPELREIVESRITDNLLQKRSPERNHENWISNDSPNLIPPEAKAATGRDDPRWAAFDETVRSEARMFEVDEAAVDKALGVIEPQFTELMNAANKKGYTVYDMNTMLSRSIIDAIQIADARQQQWERFCEQVRRAGADVCPAEKLDLVLQELGDRYQQLIAKSLQEGWTKEETDSKIILLIFDEKWRLPIDGRFAKVFIESIDDDWYSMPEDAGAMFDEPIKSAEQYIAEEDDEEIGNTL